jgi:haloacid dehalogenase-like hydrolase
MTIEGFHGWAPDVPLEGRWPWVARLARLRYLDPTASSRPVPNPQRPVRRNMRYGAVAVDCGGTLTEGEEDPALRQRPIAPDAAAALRDLHALGLRLILVSNTRPQQDRRLALRAAGIANLFAITSQSDSLGVTKPDPAGLPTGDRCRRLPAGPDPLRRQQHPQGHTTGHGCGNGWRSGAPPRAGPGGNPSGRRPPDC